MSLFPFWDQLLMPRMLIVIVLCLCLFRVKLEWIAGTLLIRLLIVIIRVPTRLWWVALLVYCFCSKCMLVLWKKLLLTFADWKFICSAKQVGFRLSFMIGILQNFLEGYDTKYIKALLLQFSIWSNKWFCWIRLSNWLTGSQMHVQIFQWLASMPVELEGYIRPGCTILTSFIAMPNIMWINVRAHLDVLYIMCSCVVFKWSCYWLPASILDWLTVWFLVLLITLDSFC